jgi:hypothetical protein
MRRRICLLGGSRVGVQRRWRSAGSGGGGGAVRCAATPLAVCVAGTRLGTVAVVGSAAIDCLAVGAVAVGTRAVVLASPVAAPTTEVGGLPPAAPVAAVGGLLQRPSLLMLKLASV